MILTTLDIIIFSMIFIIVVLVVFLFVKNYSKIMSFIYPNDWNYITVLEADNTCTIQKKNKDLRFEFNDGFYNMYDTEKTEIDLPNPDGTTTKDQIIKRNETAIYRSGRLAQFFYIEGNSEPLDFRNNKISSNPQMRKQLLSVDLTKLWTMGNQVKTWILYAIVGFLIGVIIGNVIGGYNKIPKPQEVQQAIALIWVGKNAGKFKSGWFTKHSRHT